MAEAPRAAASRLPARRTQAERTAQTRERILAAVVESIAEVGFGRTTANEIARRANVTWGAVQHHFGGKDGILEAVLADSFERFADRLADIPSDTAIEQRVSLFVDRAWQHFRGPHYRSTLEILLHLNPTSREGEGWQGGMVETLNRIWKRLFADRALSPRRVALLQRYAVSVLSGLSSLEMLDGRRHSRAGELALLEQTLLSELCQGSESEGR
jgi:AcrR family transcriptional regulator